MNVPRQAHSSVLAYTIDVAVREWMSFLFYGILIAVLLATGFVAGGWYQKRTGGHLHSAIRTTAILSQAKQRDLWPAVVAGDSLVELALINEVCGKPALNAGLGGARLADTALILNQVLERAKAARVVVAVGINDSQRDWTPDKGRAFAREYVRLVRSLKARGLDVSIARIAPVGADGRLTKALFSLDAIRANNAAIEKIAAAEGVGLVNFDVLTDAQRGLHPNDTTDGIHLSQSGYRKWRESMNLSLCAKTAIP
jgi:lysophospholipase L1-like esterase